MSLIYTFLTGQDYLLIIAWVHGFYMQNTLFMIEIKNTNKKTKKRKLLEFLLLTFDIRVC